MKKEKKTTRKYFSCTRLHTYTPKMYLYTLCTNERRQIGCNLRSYNRKKLCSFSFNSFICIDTYWKCICYVQNVNGKLEFWQPTTRLCQTFRCVNVVSAHKHVHISVSENERKVVVVIVVFVLPDSRRYEIEFRIDWICSGHFVHCFEFFFWSMFLIVERFSKSLFILLYPHKIAIKLIYFYTFRTKTVKLLVTIVKYSTKHIQP